jgi:hypothetical protein
MAQVVLTKLGSLALSVCSAQLLAHQRAKTVAQAVLLIDL